MASRNAHLDPNARDESPSPGGRVSRSSREKYASACSRISLRHTPPAITAESLQAKKVPYLILLKCLLP